MFGAIDVIRRQPRGGELIFPLRPNSVSTLFPRACRKVGIVGLRFHDLRHTAVTRMFQRGMSLEEVALVSGHRTWQQLRRYTHLRPADLARKYAALEPPPTPEGSPEDTG